HAHASERARFLREVAEAQARTPVHGPGRDLLVAQLDAAAVGPDEPDDHVEAGGLARAVRSQQRHDLAARQADVDGIDDLASAVALAQAPGPQYAFRTGSTGRCQAGPGGARH